MARRCTRWTRVFTAGILLATSVHAFQSVAQPWKRDHLLLTTRKHMLDPSCLHDIDVDTVAASHSLSMSSSSLVNAAIEVFDGSTIQDTVVVSSAYWVNLKAQLWTLFLGQVGATVIFALVATLTVQRAPQVIDKVVQDLQQRQQKETTSTFSNNKSNTNRTPLQVPPSPVDVDLSKLFTCLALDLVGATSELIPLWGQLVDLAYAPLAAYLLRNLFGGSNVAFAIELLEESLPFTDALPFCTICWVIDTWASDSDLARVLQLGRFRRLAADGTNTKQDKEDTQVR